MGGEIAGILADHFGSIDALARAEQEDLEEIPAVGPRIAESVYQWFRDEANLRVLDKLRRAGVRMAEEAPPAPPTGPLAGQSFVITGTLASMPRSRAEELIRALGGAAGDSVTRKTDYLVVGEAPGSKLQKAQQYGTKLLNEEEFLDLLRKHGAIEYPCASSAAPNNVSSPSSSEKAKRTRPWNIAGKNSSSPAPGCPARRPRA